MAEKREKLGARAAFSDTLFKQFKLFKAGIIKSNSLEVICKHCLSSNLKRKSIQIYTTG